MSPKEFLDAMQTIAQYNESDPDGSHSEADDLMCRVLKQLGYGVGVSVFENMDKEYS